MGGECFLLSEKTFLTSTLENMTSHITRYLTLSFKNLIRQFKET